MRLPSCCNYYVKQVQVDDVEDPSKRDHPDAIIRFVK